MAKLKKDGTPKKSGGHRAGAGQPSNHRANITFRLDTDLVKPFTSLSANDKNALIREGLES